MKRLLLLSMLIAFFSCKKNIQQDSSRPPIQSEFKPCGLSDPARGINTRRIPYVTSADLLNETEVIYISYGGETVTSVFYAGGTPFVAGPSGFVQAQIDEIQKNVNEDFSPYTYILTNSVSVYNAAPVGRRTKCIVASNLAPIIGNVGGTTAYIGCGIPILPADEAPCLVRSEQSLTSVALAISHEIGHTLGLFHQAKWTSTVTPCVMADPYNQGIGYPSAASWGPIMGAPYTVQIKSWHTGYTSQSDFNTGCPTNYQNDLAVLNAVMPYKTDVDKNVLNTFNLPGMRVITKGSQLTGVLEQQYDRDFIKLSATAGTVCTISIKSVGPIPPGYIGNTDFLLQIWKYNALGNTLLASVGPSIDPSIDLYSFTIPAGLTAVYLLIRGDDLAPWQPVADMAGSWVLKVD